MRRALGFMLGKESRLLRDLAAFAEAADVSAVTTDVAAAWAILPQNATPVWAAQRLSMVRGFARYLQAFDPQRRSRPSGCCRPAPAASRPASTPTPTSPR